MTNALESDLARAFAGRHSVIFVETPEESRVARILDGGSLPVVRIIGLHRDWGKHN